MHSQSQFRGGQNAAVLLAGVSALAMTMGAGSALAQTAAPTAKAPGVEEVIVTGSRIRGVAPVGSTVVSVGRAEISTSGAVTTADLVQQVPQILNYGVTDGSRSQSGGSSNVTFGNSINIRGIGPFATLTLIDSHRVVPQGTSGFAVDPSVVPTIGLERIEIVADGASAIYGSDAIAGVANLILRRNFEGVEASARYGAGKDYNDRQIGIIAGHRWSSGQLTLAYENGFHTALSGLDRNFENNVTAYQNGKNLVTQCNPGTITAGGVTYAIPAGGVTAANRGALVAGTSNKCDNTNYQDLLPRQNHNSFDFTFNQTINDRVSVFADGLFARREFRRAVGAATATVTVPSGNPYFVAPPGTGPASETVAYSFARDFVNPASYGYSQSYSVTLGGEVKLVHDWKLEANYMFGRDDDLNQAYGQVNAAALTAAANSTNPATAFNAFGGGNSASVLAPILVGFTFQPGITELRAYEAKLDGPLFMLPAGEIRAAVGYEGQSMTVDNGQDGGTLLVRTVARRHFSRKVDSFYGEILIPLVSDANAMPGVRRLDIDIAGRSDHYSDVGSTRNPKIGVNWAPVKALTVHGSYGTSFRAPTISQIYGNSNSLFVQNYADPTLGGAIRQGVALSGGNLDLHPETATTYSFGVDYQPEWLPRSKFSVTYFSVDYQNQVAAYLQDLTILLRENLFAGTPIIQRNPTAAFISQLAQQTGFTGVLPNPTTLFVDGRNYNLGKSETRGFDFDFRYAFPQDHYGDFAVGLSGTYLTSYKTAITASAPLLNMLNIIQNPLRLRARGNLTWSKGSWSAMSALNYVNGYTNNLATPVQSVNAYATIDLHLGYAFGDQLPGRWLHGIQVGLDVSNLFDKQAPFVNVATTANGGGGYDPNVASPIGRIVAVSIDKRW